MEFDVREECRFVDVHELEVARSPLRYIIDIEGEITTDAIVCLNLLSDAESLAMNSDTIVIKRGKVKIRRGSDMYVPKMYVIYIPDSIGKTEGHLKVKVEIQ